MIDDNIDDGGDGDEDGDDDLEGDNFSEGEGSGEGADEGGRALQKGGKGDFWVEIIFFEQFFIFFKFLSHDHE